MVRSKPYFVNFVRVAAIDWSARGARPKQQAQPAKVDLMDVWVSQDKTGPLASQPYSATATRPSTSFSYMCRAGRPPVCMNSTFSPALKWPWRAKPIRPAMALPV